MDLLNNEMVTEVAHKYGYQSIDGFTRASKWSGILPSEVSRKGISKYFPKLSFAITVRGGTHMDFRIENKPSFNIVGVSKRVRLQFEGVNQEIRSLHKALLMIKSRNACAAEY